MHTEIVLYIPHILQQRHRNYCDVTLKYLAVTINKHHDLNTTVPDLNAYTTVPHNYN